MLILGRADIATTQGVYEHDDMESRRENMQRIEKLLVSKEARAADSIYCRQIGRQKKKSNLLSWIPSLAVLSGLLSNQHGFPYEN